MLKYIINLSFLFFAVIVCSQEDTKTTSIEDTINENSISNIEIENDSLSYKTAYGFRFGIDISKPIINQIDETYSGIELVADYRVSKNLYIAAEMGYEEKESIEDFTNSTSSGSYFKVGVNLNFYENWLDMNNEIYGGFRYGASIFQQTLNSYNTNTNDANYSGYFSNTTVTPNDTETGLQIHWLEIQAGTKVETFKNLFVGFHTSFKLAVSVNQQTGFGTLYAPGFNRVYSTKTGFGFNYTISYLIPFSKK